MKGKIARTLTAVLCAVCIFFANTICTYAAGYVGSIETTARDIIIEVTVDNEESIHGIYETVDNPQDRGYEVEVEFNYTGDRPLEYWEVPGLIEGVDYVIVSQEGTKIKIGILDPEIDYIWANAVTGERPQTSTAEKDTGRKSPNTGVGVAFALTAFGTGALALAVKKRKN